MNGVNKYSRPSSPCCGRLRFYCDRFIDEVREGAKKYKGAKLRAEEVPVDRVELAAEATPNIAPLLQKTLIDLVVF